MNYKPLFPWFGGKSRVSSPVWMRFGNVPNYVEPFFGSGAVLFKRPYPAKVETINDADGYVANFWRAVREAPESVAEWADYPVNEIDLHARHAWLIEQKDDFTQRLISDPLYFDPKVAGWWVWGICQWIGSGWCVTSSKKRPSLGNAGRGVHAGQIPHLGNAGQGIHAKRIGLIEAFSTRLRSTRVCCGDWTRVMGKSVTYGNGVSGVFLDPPYTEKANRKTDLYANDSLSVGHDVFKWAIENGHNKKLRIAVCGYDGEYDFPEDWECVAWKAAAGYASVNSNNENKNRERIWFSPHCLKPVRQPQLPFGIYDDEN